MRLCTRRAHGVVCGRTSAAVLTAACTLTTTLVRRPHVTRAAAVTTTCMWRRDGACVSVQRHSSSSSRSNTVQHATAPPPPQQQQHDDEHDSSNNATTGYDPWRVLGLPAGAPAKALRSRYHELMRQVHPDLCGDGVGDVARMTQINKAYELLTRSPTLDTRYRNLVSDRQYVYYRVLPEWMARNLDEMPRYWSWVRWRAPSSLQVVMLCAGLYLLGKLFRLMPMATTVLVVTWCLDVLLHTMLAPAALTLVFLYGVLSYRSYNMAWLTSPKGFLRRELGY